MPLAEDMSDGNYVVMNPGDRPPKKMEEMEEWFHNPARTGHAYYASATEGYFRTMGIPLLRGRWFEDRDTIDAPQVALINQALARQQWPNQDPIGRILEFGNMDGDLRPVTIVGVIGDTRDHKLETPPRPNRLHQLPAASPGRQATVGCAAQRSEPSTDYFLGASNCSLAGSKCSLQFQHLHAGVLIVA